MSARKSFPKSKASNQLTNNSEKTNFFDGPGSQTEGEAVTDASFNGCNRRETDLSNSKLSLVSHKKKGDIADSGYDALPLQLKIKQEDTSWDTTTYSEDLQKLIKPLEIKLDKTSISEYKASEQGSQSIRKSLKQNSKSIRRHIPTSPKSLPKSQLPIMPNSSQVSPEKISSFPKSSVFKSSVERSASIAKVNPTQTLPTFKNGTIPPMTTQFSRNKLPAAYHIPKSPQYTKIPCTKTETRNEASLRKEPGLQVTNSPKKITTVTAANRLSPNDLRHVIGTKKTEQHKPDDIDSLDDEAFEDNVDSMSIHADDDDLFDDDLAKEDLNSLGKHFSSLSEKTLETERSSPGESSSRLKRKNLEKLDHDQVNKRGTCAENTRTLNRSASANTVTDEQSFRAREFDRTNKRSSNFENRFPNQAVMRRGMSYPPRGNERRPKSFRVRDQRIPRPHVNHNARFRQPVPILGQRPILDHPGFIPNRFPPHVDWSRPPAYLQSPVFPFQHGFFPDLPIQNDMNHNSVRYTSERQAGFETVTNPNACYTDKRNVGVPDFQQNSNKSLASAAAPLPSGADQEDKSAETIQQKETEKLYNALKAAQSEGNIENCITICEDIIKLNGNVDVKYLDDLMNLFADGTNCKVDSKSIRFVFDHIRRARVMTGFRTQDFESVIHAYYKSEDVDSAIDIVLEMKGKGFKPSQSLLVLIKNGFFEFSVKNIDRFIRLCDEFDNRELISRRLVEEILKYIEPDKLKAETKSGKISSILQDMKPEELLRYKQALQPKIDNVQNIMEKLDHIKAKDTPADLLVHLINSTQTFDHAVIVTEKLSTLPSEVLASIGSDAWNEFLMESCTGRYEHIQIANQIQGLMSRSGIPMQNKVCFQLVCSLLKAGYLPDAMQNLNLLKHGELNVDDLSDETYDCLCRTLQSNDTVNSYNIIMIFIRCKRKPPEDKLLDVLNSLNDSAEYQQMQDIITELRNSDMQPSFQVYHLALTALENWDDNPDAVIDIYREFRKAFPQNRIFSVAKIHNEPAPLSPSCSMEIPLSDEDKTTSSTSSTKELYLRSDDDNVCRYFLSTGKICPNGSNCRFSHILPPPALKSAFENTLKVAAWQEMAKTQGKSTDEVSKPDSGYLSGESGNQVTISLPGTSAQYNDTETEYTNHSHRPMLLEKRREINDTSKENINSRETNGDVNDAKLEMIFDNLINRESPSLSFINHANTVMSKVDTSSSQFMLQFSEKQGLGRLAVRLIIHCYNHTKYREAYIILNSLQELEISYWLCGRSFNNNDSSISACQIAVLAVDLCLKQDTPNLDGAVEVLRGTNYALPSDANENIDEIERLERNRILSVLLDELIKEKKNEQAFEVLEKTDNVFLGNSLRHYNQLLLDFSNDNQVENANRVYESMQVHHIDIDRISSREYLNCLIRSDSLDLAREAFANGCQHGVYPIQNPNKPYFIEMPCDLSQIEMTFLLERHLHATRSIRSIPAALSESPTLRIAFVENEDLHDSTIEQFATARENMFTVLRERMHPPLWLLDKEPKKGVICVDYTSVRQWLSRVPSLSQHHWKSNEGSSPVKKRSVIVEPVSTAPYFNLSAQEDEFAITLPESMSTDGTSSRNIRIEESRLSKPRKEKEKNIKGVTYFICARVMEYMSQGRVVNWQQCVQTICKLWRKQNREKWLPSNDQLEEEVHKFVDVFFQDHGHFVPKLLQVPSSTAVAEEDHG